MSDESNKKVVAQTEKSKLLAEDLSNIIGQPISELDSIKKSQEAINQWAREEILFEQAQNYFNDGQLAELDNIISQYKRDLYIARYKSMIIQSKLNTEVTQQEKQIYYDQDLESLTLNQVLFKYRYLSFVPENPRRYEFIQRFTRYNAEDKIILDSLSILNFSKVQFNDSIWFEQNQLVNSIPIVDQQNINQFKIRNKLYRRRKSDLTHLLYISDLALPGEKPPIEYINNLIERLIINKRKQTLEKEFDNDIINQALRSENLQIY
ncbi:MAG: hypothetical protein OXE55_03925 [Flavobacteriaceae bacterium]|nr:hypothetical protein [Flavobacteriaceae bacterium]